MSVNCTDEAKKQRLQALASTRRDMYTFLSEGFSQPPSQGRLQAVRGAEFLGSAHELFEDQVLAALRQYACMTEPLEQLERDARQEFMNLFKVPGGQYVAPYESVYRDTREIAGRKVKGLLMGQSAVDVQRWYRLAAVVISEEYKDLPDHICLEFGYLAHLCGKEQEFASAQDRSRLWRTWEMERDFIAGHMVLWVEPFREKIYEKSKHPYFRALADMAVQLLCNDLAMLEDVLGPGDRP